MTIPHEGIIEVMDTVEYPPVAGGVYCPHRTVPESRRLYIDGHLVALGPDAVDEYIRTHPLQFPMLANAE